MYVKIIGVFIGLDFNETNTTSTEITESLFDNAEGLIIRPNRPNESSLKIESIVYLVGEPLPSKQVEILKKRYKVNSVKYVKNNKELYNCFIENKQKLV